MALFIGLAPFDGAANFPEACKPWRQGTQFDFILPPQAIPFVGSPQADGQSSNRERYASSCLFVHVLFTFALTQSLFLNQGSSKHWFEVLKARQMMHALLRAGIDINAPCFLVWAFTACRLELNQNEAL